MKTFDASKFKKSVTKSIKGISAGFKDPDTWVSTGNYALNYLMSGRFDVGIPLSKVTIFGGSSGSGKSYVCSANVVKDAQARGIFVVLIDTENALDESWLEALGVSTDESKLLKFNVSFINDVAKIFNEFCDNFEADFPLPAEGEVDDRPKVLFIVDSLGMLSTPISDDQFTSGNMKGDMGWKAKMLKSLITGCVSRCQRLNIGFLATNHTYQSQDMFSPDPIISGGSGPIFAASTVVALDKLKLKEDDAGNKISQVTGIRAKMKVVKSRFSKPFEEVVIKIPYETGMNPYSGLFDLFVKKDVLKKPSGNMYIYTEKETGVVHKYFQKKYEANHDGILDLIIKEWDETEVVMNQLEDSDGDNIVD